MHLPERSASGCGIEGVANMMQTVAATSATPSTAHNLGGRGRLQVMSDKRLLLAGASQNTNAHLVTPLTGSKGLLGSSLIFT